MEKQNFKKSESSYIVPYEENKYIFVSNIKAKVIIGDALLKDIIENPNAYLYKNQNEVKYLYKNGFIIDSDAIEEDILSENFEKSINDVPLIFVLLLTLNCNFNCVYCFQGEENKKRNITFKRDDVKKIVEFMKKKFNQYDDEKFILTLTGGEPLLKFPLIQEIVSEIEKQIGRNRLSIRLITNGSLLDEEKCRFLGKRDWISTQITVDGTEEYHNKMRPYSNGNDSFYDVIKGLDNSLKYCKEVILRVNAWPENLRGIENFLDFLQKKGYAEKDNFILGFHQIQNFCYTVKDKLNGLTYSSSQWGDMSFKFHELAHLKGFKNIDLPLAFPRMLHCGANSLKVFHILPDGRVATCWGASGNMDNFVIGTIQNNNFNNDEYLKNIEKLKKYNPFKQDKCKKCKVFAFCGGGCLAEALSENGDISESICSYVAANPEEYIRLFVNERLRKGRYSTMKFS